MKIKKLLATAALATIPVAADSKLTKEEMAAELLTCGAFNGEYFRLVSDEMQYGFLTGVVDAARWGAKVGVKEYIFFSSDSFTVIQKEMIKFYADPRNRRVPVILALGVVTDKLEGTDKNALDKTTKLVRKIVAADCENLFEKKEN